MLTFLFVFYNLYLIIEMAFVSKIVNHNVLLSQRAVVRVGVVFGFKTIGLQNLQMNRSAFVNLI